MRRAPALAPALGVAALFSIAAVNLDATAVDIARLATLGAALGALAWIDLLEHRIPNPIVAPATAICATLLLIDGVDVPRLLGGLVLLGSLLALSLAWPASIGMGDVKLALLVVAGLGGLAAQALVLGLVLAAAFGAILVVRHGRSAGARSLPLAPFIATGAAAVMLA